MLKIYNTLTRKIDLIQPQEAEEVRLYTCGPTVYDHAHIGNLGSYIFADTLRRVIAQSNVTVSHAMNYTDVDDKTIRRSRETYPHDEPRAALTKLTNLYIDIFLADMQAVGNDTTALTFLRATDTIEEMKRLITELLRNGFAYVAHDGIYFSIEAYRKSGKTYGQLLELTASNTSEARIQNDEYDKESAHDFSLWKKQKDGEPSWEFIIDELDMTGRPGWHIECSVMSRKALGQPFDIHTGGVDLIFPHHENEIAQSTAGQTSATMATIFAHNNHMLVENKKMSKSLQNFYTLEDVKKRQFDPLALRMLVLQGHYRNQVNFTWDSLEAAQNRLNHWREIAVLRWQLYDTLNTDAIKGHDELTAYIFSESQAVKAALDDDLDTPTALQLVDKIFSRLEQQPSHTQQSALQELLELLDAVLGLQLLATTPDISLTPKQHLIERQRAREAKDWATSDQLRDELLRLGVAVRDTATGPIWSYKAHGGN